jgi:hypothetical protein
MGSRPAWILYIISFAITLMLVLDMAPTSGTNAGEKNYTIGQHTNMDKTGRVLIM